jgi:hypothetical protein
MSFHPSNHDAIDDPQILICFKPTVPDQGLKDVTSLRNLLHYLNTKLWDKSTGTGGGDSCFFAKDLEKHPRRYTIM